MLEELSTTAQEVAKRTEGAVVRVGGGRRGGSAIVVSDRRVLTNAHNIDDDVVSVRTVDGRVLEATVAGVDVDGDLAVLEVETGGPALSFSDAEVSIGRPVFAIGVAHRGARMTFGLVSGVGAAFRGPGGRRINGSIEHTAPMAPGSSGSALVDAGGQLVGLNTSRRGGGFYLALPTDAAFRARVDRLAAGERIERPRIGISIVPSWVAQRMRGAVGLDRRDGLLVREVDPDGPASRAGLAVGDLLVAVDDHAVDDPDDLADAIEAATTGLDIKIVRGDREMTLTVQFDEG